VADVRTVKNIINRIFPLRKCRKFIKRKRPCLNYQISRCTGPCTGKISSADYRIIADEIRIFLSGNHTKLILKLESEMQDFKKKQQYENAAVIRDKIENINNFFPIVNFRKITKTKVKTLKKINPSYILKDILNMKKIPVIIEGYDISHTASQLAVGSMVCFKNSEPDRSNYRRFQIKGPRTCDDIKMISQIVSRRLKRIIKENLPFPDIILIDGGKAQESAARKIITGLNINSIKTLSLAKDNNNIYHNGKILKIDKDSDAFKLLKMITDEAHRFAHSYHVKRRDKNNIPLVDT
ncbi:UvrB/UvrC motif-containing protein, partial [Elusimicrobiota bacterium]